MFQSAFLPASSHAFPTMGSHYFPSHPTTLSLEVVAVDNPGTSDDQLNDAVNLLIPAALERKQGILVIQHGYGKYTVRIDQEVPCGVTLESRDSNAAM